MFSWFRKKKDRSQAVIEPIYQWSDDEIPRYPPFMKGLPAVRPEKLVETQSELVERIKNTAIATPKDFSRYYAATIARFASYAHLLPASQSHHHRGAGGLFRHCLEVGLWALQSADKVLLESARTPSQRREMEPRWQFAVFAAALCHDAGKPVTDVTVTNRDRSVVWKPIKEDLYEWAAKNKVEAYFLDWREGRGRQHTALSNLIADRIIGPEALEWIEEGGTELVVWLLESLNCNPGPSNLIHDLVVKADQTSVERDLKTLGVAMAGYDLGVPVERHLTDIMRRFIREGVWLVNEPGARVWNIGGHIYLVWPAAGEEIVKQVKEDGIPGVPRTPDGILDMLVERQIAHLKEDAQPGDRLWKIAPACLAEKIPDIKLTAIRLRDEALVSTAPIPSVEGRVVNDGGDERQIATNQNKQPDLQKQQDTAETQTPAATDTPVGAAISEANNQTPANASDRAEIAARGDRKPDPTPTQVPRQAKGEPSMPTAIEGSNAGDTKAAKAGIAVQGEARPSIVLDGAVGEALKALAQDLKSGDKRWGVDAAIDADQQVLLRWPDAFNGYGLATKLILEELGGKGWLWIDPMAPLKKVTEAQIGSETVKAIRLTREISRALVCCAEEAPTVGDRGPQGPAGQEVKQKKSASQPKTPKRATKRADPGSEKPAGLNDLDGIDAASEEGGGHPQDKKDDVKESFTPPSIEDLIAAIKHLPAAVQSDGFVLISKQDVFSACKQQGLRITHRRLWELADQNPDSLSLDGGAVRVRL